MTVSTSAEVQYQHYDPPKRPWLSLYNVMLRPKGMRARDEILEVELAPIQLKLPDELMQLILSRLGPYTLGKVACVCQQWRSYAENPLHWEQACKQAFGSKQDVSLDRASLLKHHNGSWKRMFLHHPHVRFDGVYVCRNTYIRTGVIELQRNAAPVHLVSYYRYYVFQRDGSFLYRTTPQPLKTVQRSLRGNQPQSKHKDESVFRGRYIIKGPKVYCVVVYPNSRGTEIRSILKIRSTYPGANNRLDIESIYSFDRDMGQALPGGLTALSPDEPLGQGDRRGYSRGMAPGVFVPWEEVMSTPLNLPPKEMDFYLPG